MNQPKLAFSKRSLVLPLEKIRPLRAVRDPEKRFSRYGRIVSSIRKHGLVEALVVNPIKEHDGMYLRLMEMFQMLDLFLLAFA